MSATPLETFVGRAPGRVNLIGEHTDYNGGFVLPIAIHLGVTATVTVRDDAAVVIESAQVPGEAVRWGDVADLRPGACEGWTAYVAGAVWALRPLAEMPTGLRIVVDGNVPLGAGLSSSAALECAVATAVCAAWGIDLPRRAVAAAAQRAENEFVGVPTGSMDQVASMLGRSGNALFFDVRADTVEYVPLRLQDAGLNLVVIDTRASHALVDGGYAARRASCEEAARLLDVPALRDIDASAQSLANLTEVLGSDVLLRRARHVVTENQRVLDAVDCLQANDYRSFGGLMVQSHQSLRDDFEVSCAELDCAVEAALASGAWGARMTGGGFGGSALALVPSDAADGLVRAVQDAFAERTFAQPVCWSVAAADGAHLVA